MVLSFGSFADAYEGPDINPATGSYDPSALIAYENQSTSSSSGWGDFLKTLGVSLLGTTANVTARELASRKSPEDIAKAQAAAAAAAAQSRNQMLVIGGVVVGIVVVGALLLRRRSAS